MTTSLSSAVEPLTFYAAMKALPVPSGYWVKLFSFLTKEELLLDLKLQGITDVEELLHVGDAVSFRYEDRFFSITFMPPCGDNPSKQFCWRWFQKRSS